MDEHTSHLHKETLDARPSCRSSFLHFHAVFNKIWHNNMLTPLSFRLQNPGCDPDKFHLQKLGTFILFFTAKLFPPISSCLQCCKLDLAAQNVLLKIWELHEMIMWGDYCLHSDEVSKDLRLFALISCSTCFCFCQHVVPFVLQTRDAQSRREGRHWLHFIIAQM